MSTKTLKLTRVTKNFGGVQAVCDLTLEAKSRQITGLIGPNGAGKSTVVNLIAGMLRISEGAISLDGHDISELPPHEVARAGITRTFQNIRLVSSASAVENVMSGFHRLEKASLLENLLGFPAARRESRKIREMAHALMGKLGIENLAEIPAAQLPYGHQRKVEIGRALATSPDFLLLDEPVAGMNQIESDELVQLIVEVVQSGVGILLIEHDMSFIQKLCSELYVLNSGTLIARGPPEQVMRDPAVIEAYLGA